MRTLILAILFLSFTSVATQNTITGVVSDETGPLPGASIVIKGTQKGTESDFDGKYSIIANMGEVLVYSYVGMTTMEKKVGNNPIINVVMKGNESLLEEVVFVAYGTNRKPFFERSKKEKNVADYQPINDESYKGINENKFKTPQNDPLSTFSVDVDRASYANIRRIINEGQEIPEDAIKIEEMINYFPYNYGQPTDEHPFAIHTDVAQCPWETKHYLARIALQGKKIDTEKLPASNLIFLIDVSGSMQDYNKLPLLKSAFKLLVNQLREKDKVAIVVYAGAAGVVLQPTSGNKKEKIIDALDRLEAGGSTAGAAGIHLAYELAEKNFIDKGNNRVILATDGDFNVGTSSDDDLQKLIEEKLETGVFLTALGFGMGNYKDSKLETLADKGNGNHAYIDGIQEAQKVLGKEFGGTLFTIAKDVKIQVEFNPSIVQAYRLVGYENRLLNDEDFTDDKIDAGEIGSGHTVTALYEIIPVGVKSDFTKDLPLLKYSEKKNLHELNSELFTVKFRYKKPDGNKSTEMVKVVGNEVKNMEQTDENFRFTASVAMLGMQLRNSEFKGNTDYDKIVTLANAAKSKDEDGYRSEFVKLVKKLK